MISCPRPLQRGPAGIPLALHSLTTLVRRKRPKIQWGLLQPSPRFVLPALQGLLPMAAPLVLAVRGKGWWCLSFLAVLALNTATYQVRRAHSCACKRVCYCSFS